MPDNVTLGDSARAPDGTVFDWHGASDGPVVVLVHGLGLRRQMWAPHLSALSSFRVLTYDLIGHGQGPIPGDRVELQDLADQLAGLLDHLGIKAAALVGFSMGGMVVRRFAQDHPHRVLALGILNSAHQRSAKAQVSIQNRLAQAHEFGPTTTVELALERWFTPGFHATNPAMIAQVRQWIAGTDAQHYHKLFRILVEDLEQVIAPTPPLMMPTLVMASRGDYGQSPDMATAIAADIAGAECVIIPDLNHMAATENPAAYTLPLVDFLNRNLAPPDTRALRAALGTFATGVTVVTTLQPDGTPRGFTANSFTSVSLNPPLVLVCVAKSAHSQQTFSTAPYFAINILSDEQKSTSGLFASRAADKFNHVAWQAGPAGLPYLDGALAHMACARHQLIDAGDHVILMGRVIDYTTQPGLPLGYFRGNYFDIGLEQRLVSAALEAGPARVGAILQAETGLLFQQTPEGLRLPSAANLAALNAELAALGISADIDFLYAVNQEADSGAQAFYYHGHVQGTLPATFCSVPLAKLAQANLADSAERTMLTRYAGEYLHGEFGN